MTLTEFLLARITEDEARAPVPSWTSDDGGCLDCGGQSESRVLAECEAKRRIVEWHRMGNDDGYVCRNILCPHLAALASVYAEHPDFDPAWQISP
jgi:hypothetical protein